MWRDALELGGRRHFSPRRMRIGPVAEPGAEPQRCVGRHRDLACEQLLHVGARQAALPRRRCRREAVSAYDVGDDEAGMDWRSSPCADRILCHEIAPLAAPIHLSLRLSLLIYHPSVAWRKSTALGQALCSLLSALSIAVVRAGSTAGQAFRSLKVLALPQQSASDFFDSASLRLAPSLSLYA
jgi:hypothetical protein